MVSSKLAQHKRNELGSDGKCVQELLNIHGTERDLSPNVASSQGCRATKLLFWLY